MPSANCTDEQFVALFRVNGAAGTAKILGHTVRAVYLRRAKLEKFFGPIVSPSTTLGTRLEEYPQRVYVDIEDGVVIVFSDAHYWPGLRSTAHRGLCHLAKELKPRGIANNGDAFDGATNGRHPPNGWEQKPSLNGERQAVDEALSEIEAAAPGAELWWELGNHDARFENKLASQTPEYEGIPGFRLQDHFPKWKMGVSLWINNDVVIKHRWKGGVHATHNNAVGAGKTLVTGHLHSLKVTPYADYNGNRFGVDTGTLAEPYGPQFRYAEDNPLNHRSGFVVLTFHKGKLLWPEIVHVIEDGKIEFRGKVIDV